jgi:hypothetical protein
MVRQKDGDEERAQADERPFEDDLRPLGCKSAKQSEPNRQIKEAPQQLTSGEDSPTPGGEANWL